MRYGGDETCFLFNLTQNMRFDTLKNQQDLPGDIPIYAMTTTQGLENEEDISNLSETDNNIDGGSPSEQDESNSDEDEDIERNSRDSGEGAKKKYKKNMLKNNVGRKRGLSGVNNKTPQLSFGRTDLVISVRIKLINNTFRMILKL